MKGPAAPESFDNRKYWETRLREHYSLAGVGYLRLGRRFNEWMYRVRGEVFDRVAAELLPSWSGKAVLDVGSGTGFYVERWLRLGARVTGLGSRTSEAANASATMRPHSSGISAVGNAWGTAK